MNSQAATASAAGEQEQPEDLSEERKLSPEQRAPIRQAGTVATSAIFGQAVAMMAGMREFRNLSLGDLEWLLLPPIALGQFKLYRDKLNRPVAFVAWAFLSEEVETRLQQPFGRLLPEEWKSGDRASVLILAAPAERTNEILADLGRTSLSETSVSFLRPASGGWRVVEVEDADPIVDNVMSVRGGE